ncbi:hypothetical protein CSUI_004100 [Cystoisospora suis]|uniref:Uncharacterized protein n=1 Tax=Cystoisospora suis TaxID=483139 RepID=A0A2C6KZZ7_9APIC|nr:hypothetical protein CSUI_004100 [Cystoisospora suis]
MSPRGIHLSSAEIRESTPVLQAATPSTPGGEAPETGRWPPAPPFPPAKSGALHPKPLNPKPAVREQPGYEPSPHQENQPRTVLLPASDRIDGRRVAGLSKPSCQETNIPRAEYQKTDNYSRFPVTSTAGAASVPRCVQAEKEVSSLELSNRRTCNEQIKLPNPALRSSPVLQNNTVSRRPNCASASVPDQAGQLESHRRHQPDFLDGGQGLKRRQNIAANAPDDADTSPQTVQPAIDHGPRSDVQLSRFSEVSSLRSDLDARAANVVEAGAKELSRQSLAAPPGPSRRATLLDRKAAQAQTKPAPATSAFSAVSRTPSDVLYNSFLSDSRLVGDSGLTGVSDRQDTPIETINSDANASLARAVDGKPKERALEDVFESLRALVTSLEARTNNTADGKLPLIPLTAASSPYLSPRHTNTSSILKFSKAGLGCRDGNGCNSERQARDERCPVCPVLSSRSQASYERCCYCGRSQQESLNSQDRRLAEEERTNASNVLTGSPLGDAVLVDSRVDLSERQQISEEERKCSSQPGFSKAAFQQTRCVTATLKQGPSQFHASLVKRTHRRSQSGSEQGGGAGGTDSPSQHRDAASVEVTRCKTQFLLTSLRHIIDQQLEQLMEEPVFSAGPKRAITPTEAHSPCQVPLAVPEGQNCSPTHSERLGTAAAPVTSERVRQTTRVLGDHSSQDPYRSPSLQNKQPAGFLPGVCSEHPIGWEEMIGSDNAERIQDPRPQQRLMGKKLRGRGRALPRSNSVPSDTRDACGGVTRALCSRTALVVRASFHPSAIAKPGQIAESKRENGVLHRHVPDGPGLEQLSIPQLGEDTRTKQKSDGFSSPCSGPATQPGSPSPAGPQDSNDLMLVDAVPKDVLLALLKRLVKEAGSATRHKRKKQTAESTSSAPNSDSGETKTSASSPREHTRPAKPGEKRRVRKKNAGSGQVREVSSLVAVKRQVPRTFQRRRYSPETLDGVKETSPACADVRSLTRQSRDCPPVFNTPLCRRHRQTAAIRIHSTPDLSAQEHCSRIKGATVQRNRCSPENLEIVRPPASLRASTGESTKRGTSVLRRGPSASDYPETDTAAAFSELTEEEAWLCEIPAAEVTANSPASSSRSHTRGIVPRSPSTGSCDQRGLLAEDNGGRDRRQALDCPPSDGRDPRRFRSSQLGCDDGTDHLESISQPTPKSTMKKVHHHIDSSSLSSPHQQCSSRVLPPPSRCGAEQRNTQWDTSLASSDNDGAVAAATAAAKAASVAAAAASEASEVVSTGQTGSYGPPAGLSLSQPDSAEKPYQPFIFLKKARKEQDALRPGELAVALYARQKVVSLR